MTVHKYGKETGTVCEKFRAGDGTSEWGGEVNCPDCLKIGTKPVYWLGTEIKTCQVCSGAMSTVMYDCRVPGMGWANICHHCFTGYRCKLGTGLGQKYKKQTDGRWLKVKG